MKEKKEIERNLDPREMFGYKKADERRVENVTVTVTISTVDRKVRTLVYDQITHAEITEHFEAKGNGFVPQKNCKIEFGFCSMRVEEE